MLREVALTVAALSPLSCTPKPAHPAPMMSQRARPLEVFGESLLLHTYFPDVHMRGEPRGRELLLDLSRATAEIGYDPQQDADSPLSLARSRWAARATRTTALRDVLVAWQSSSRSASISAGTRRRTIGAVVPAAPSVGRPRGAVTDEIYCRATLLRATMRSGAARRQLRSLRHDYVIAIGR